MSHHRDIHIPPKKWCRCANLSSATSVCPEASAPHGGKKKWKPPFGICAARASESFGNLRKPWETWSCWHGMWMSVNFNPNFWPNDSPKIPRAPTPFTMNQQIIIHCSDNSDPLVTWALPDHPFFLWPRIVTTTQGTSSKSGCETLKMMSACFNTSSEDSATWTPPCLRWQARDADRWMAVESHHIQLWDVFLFPPEV